MAYTYNIALREVERIQENSDSKDYQEMLFVNSTK